MSSGGEEEKSKAWGSWEELLLACAVKRHGFKNWESVSMELQTKTSLPQLLTTAHCCKQKYQDLKRRFKDDALADNTNNNHHQHQHQHQHHHHHHHIPWLEQLRKVRVDELKREVQRYDLSIISLQHKVKKLEEEREKPDLEKEKTTYLLNDKTYEAADRSSDVSKHLLLSGEEESDRSVNESNSTGLSAKTAGELLVKSEPDLVPSGGGKGPVFSGSKVAEEDSMTQLSSDVQSSASFGTKRKRGSCGGGGDTIITGNGDAKSEPLIRLLDFIRTHNHVSLFERRLKSQESKEYKEVVRQHVDLETIQTRVEGGSYYSSCILTFYRDLLLLFNNAVVYFPKSSLESETALHLRNLLSNEIKKDASQEQSPPPPPQPISSASLLAKHKASAPIIVCRKRSSVSAKPSSSTFALKGDNQTQQQYDDDTTKKPASIKQPPLERSLLKVKTEEKPVITSARSSRRSSRNLTSNTQTHPAPGTSANKTQNAAAQGGLDKQETPKIDNKKKTETLDKKKSVVDFLKRIKNNSPMQTVKKIKGGEEQKKNNNSNGKKDKVKEGILLTSADNKKQKESSSPTKKSVGRPSKKTPEVSTISGKRGRASGGKEVAAAKRQSKRAKSFQTWIEEQFRANLSIC